MCACLLTASPLSEAGPVVEWGPCHIDLGREVSMMHATVKPAEVCSYKIWGKDEENEIERKTEERQ